MNIALVSNYLNRHQIPLCLSFLSLCDEFYFIATNTKDILGYQAIETAEYVIEYNKKSREQVYNIIRTIDVVIFGSTPDELIEERMKYGGLSFLYSERFFRRGLWRSFYPATRKRLMNRIGKYKNKNMYVLCTSAFLPIDLKMLRFPIEKCFRFGYFPDSSSLSLQSLLDKKKTNTIVWVGRLIDLKHPEMAIKTASFLKNKSYSFSMSIIGEGPLLSQLQSMINRDGLENHVKLLGSLPYSDVLQYMEQSSIFLFTSDKREGWGAVLNEAMGAACTPICSHLIGSAPFLVKDQINGLIFRQGDQRRLNRMVEYLLNNKYKCDELRGRAYETIHTEWNAGEATYRFMKICDCLLRGNTTMPYSCGPCSKADLIFENWM